MQYNKHRFDALPYSDRAFQKKENQRMSIFQYFMFCLCEDHWPVAGWHEALPTGLIEDEI